MVEGDKGGVWDTTSVGGGAWAIFRVQVDDVKFVIDKATGLGATVVVPYTDWTNWPPVSVPGNGWADQFSG